MNHREYFDKQAADWDNRKKPHPAKLKRIIDAAKLEEGESVLDVGSGTGVMLPLISKSVGEKGNIVALDVSYEMLKRSVAKNTAENILYIQAAAEFLPLRPALFDCCVCFAVFPHFSDKKQALKEINHSLKKNGRLVIAHAMSREKINSMHSSSGDAVSEDKIPPEDVMRRLLVENGYEKIRIYDESNFYMANAESSN